VRLPAVTGTIKRRLLINFRADPEVVGRILPERVRPKLQNGFAVVGVCLIRLEHERPAGIPRMLGMSGEHAAHRFAVEWTNENGHDTDGVFISRRHTDSLAARLAGGRVFPVESHAAHFDVRDVDGHIDFSMRSDDGKYTVEVEGDESNTFAPNSCFDSLEQVSTFFEGGSVGYSATSGADRLQGVELWTPEWKVGSFDVANVHTSYFEDKSLFPDGSIEFDHALVMRNLEHEWRAAPDL
jgi:hypothetical protein